MSFGGGGCFLPWLLLASFLGVTYGWGGLFNRFSPEMLSNMGYGGGYRSSPLLQRFQSPNDVLQELSEAEEEPCYGKKCTANEHCCPGSVCVDVDGLVGSCLFAYGLKQGELCRRDADCETGLLCSETEGVVVVGGGAGGGGGGPPAPRTCQPPITTRRQYGEDCATSGECDVARGLCCQLQRRHRQAPRKVCSYFKDPLICIGPVAAAQVKDDVEHTAGEKRLTAKTSAAVAAFNHLRRRK